MIDAVLNLLFRCAHRHLSPMTPVRKGAETFVICHDCGKKFAYDLNKMRIGKAIRRDPGPQACAKAQTQMKA